jgi:type I restriction enzyme S subunit
MKATQLKNSILQLAVQGKLVPQDPSDEPASVLLERIREEKKRLIKDGKIKKSKNESVIYRAPCEETDGADNLPYAFYERTADGAVRDITEELPFEIPESWEWVRLGEICSFTNGIAKRHAKTGDDTIVLRLADFSDIDIDYTDTRKIKLTDKEQSAYSLLSGDMVLIRVNGSRSYVGRTFLFHQRNETVAFCDHLIRGRLTGFIFNAYCCMALRSKDCRVAIEDKIVTTAGQNTISQSSLQSILLPLPPLAEQHRIAERIEELLPHIDDYHAAEQELTALNDSFPDALKKSILQAAVQGKLVEQDPADEPATALLERIRAEKAALVKAGKAKKDKHESVIFRRDNSYYEIRDGMEVCINDELPFEIPESWAWAHLDEVCAYIQRGKSPKYSPVKKYPVIAQKCNQWSGLNIDKAQFIEPDSLAAYAPERILQDMDLLWNSTGLGTLGRMAIYKTALNPYELAVADSHVTVVRPLKAYVLADYLFAYFASPSVQTVIESQSDGTTKQKELATATVKAYFVPIPPIDEQKQIVDKISELLQHCALIA